MPGEKIAGKLPTQHEARLRSHQRALCFSSIFFKNARTRKKKEVVKKTDIKKKRELSEDMKDNTYHETIALKRGYVRSRVRRSSMQVPIVCTARVICA
jgi:hypothetical protein